MAKLKNLVKNYISDLKTDVSTDTHVSKKESLSYALSNFGRSSSDTIISNTTYLNMFLTLALGIDVVAVGILMSVTTIIGYIRGPIISLMEDSTKSRWGRFRPYFLIFAPLSGIASILFFINPFYGDGEMNLIWVYTTYILYGTSAGFSGTAWAGITKTFAQSPEERGSAFSISKGLGIVATIIPSWLPLMIQYGPELLGISIRVVFIAMSCVLGVFGLLGVSTARNLRERVMIKHAEKPWKNIGMVFKNKNKLITWLCALGSPFNYLSNIAFPYVLMYCYGAYGMQTFIWGLAGICAWVALFMSKKVMKKFSSKTIIYMYNIMVFIGDLALLLIGYGSGFWFIFALFATRCFAAIFEYVSSVASDMFDTDIWDHYEWKYGIRNESTTDLVGSWLMAPISILNPLIYAWVFTKIDFQSGENVIQSDFTLKWLFIIAMVGSCINRLVSLIPYMIIKLDKKTMATVRSELIVRRAQKATDARIAAGLEPLSTDVEILGNAQNTPTKQAESKPSAPRGFFTIDYSARQGKLSKPLIKD